MIEFTFRPIECWPRAFTPDRKYSPFSAKYHNTIALLKKELAHIDARNVVVQVALSHSDIRRDGLPRADARRPEHPGVILSFEKWIPNGRFNEQRQPLGNYRPFSMPCDAFTDWISNLRAIALSLEALRRVDRYGVTQSGEQYTGWAQLPQGALSEREKALAFLVEHGGGNDAILGLDDPEMLKKAYRVAAKKLHPDNGGSHELFIQLQNAVKILERRP
jgi:hypothetical protein